MLRYSYDSSGNVTSQTVENTSLPIITGQPVKQVVVLGQVAAFSAVVDDTSGVTFQWKFNGSAISGATGDSLLLTNVNTASEGQYSVVVTNSAGSVTSTPAELLLHRAPEVNTPMPPRLIVYSDDGGSVTVTPMKPNYSPGETVTLTTTPITDSVFAGWVGDLSTMVNPISLSMNGNKTVRARFASALPRLIAYSDVGGSVTVTPMKLSYEMGETVTLTAESFAPSAFVGWDGHLSGTVNPTTLTMDSNKTVRARFASAVTLPPGLIATWRGETDASDQIGGHHGTFFSGAVVTAPNVTASGKVGGAFTFDGTVHIQVPDAAALKPAQITLEAWVFPTLVINDHQTVIACGSSTNDNDTWYLGVYYGKARFWSHGYSLIEGPPEIPVNEWTHLAATFDGTTKRLYVNGVDVARQGGMGALVYDPAPVPITIGADWVSNTSGVLFNGRIDEVAVYNRALTANEVADIFNAGFVGKNLSQPYITSPSQLPNVVLGASFTQQFETVLGTAPVSFSLSAGALPPGLHLSPTGLMHGALQAGGIFDFTVQAMDAAGESTEHLCVLRVLPPVAPPAGLVAWWRGEPAAGGVVSDHIGGHNGGFFSSAVAVPPAYTVDGKVGSALNFDGIMYVQIPDAIELHPPAITLEGWIFPTLLGPDLRMIVARRFASSSNWDPTWFLCLNGYGGNPSFRSSHFSDTGLVAYDGLESPSTVQSNEWIHIAATFDGETKRLYVNGIQIARKDGLGALIYGYGAVPLPMAITIGAAWLSNAPVEHFKGRIDEVSLYRRALSAAEIFSIADAGAAGKRIV